MAPCTSPAVLAVRTTFPSVQSSLTRECLCVHWYSLDTSYWLQKWELFHFFCFLLIVAVQLHSHVQLFATLWTLQSVRPPCLSPSPKFAQVHDHYISDAIQPSHPLTSSSPSALNLFQHQGLFQWVGYLNEITKIASLVTAGKESACNAGDPGLIPGLGRSAREGIGYPLPYSWASLVAQLVKNPLAMWETWVWSLVLEDPLEKGKTTHSSILAWRIPWTI